MNLKFKLCVCVGLAWLLLIWLMTSIVFSLDVFGMVEADFPFSFGRWIGLQYLGMPLTT